MDTLEFLRTIYAEADRGFSQMFSLPSATAVPINVADITVPGFPVGEDIYFSVGLSTDTSLSR